MPVLDSLFRPPPFLGNGHVQTVIPVLFPRHVELPLERERLDLEDGDFLDLDWSRAGRNRAAILSHGLEGSSEAGYIREMAAALNEAGWDTVAWNFRGCSGEPNRLLRSYHSGETGDLHEVVTHAARTHAEVALVGFSLGGNVTLKYLGEAPPHSAVTVAAAISVPVDLASTADRLDRKVSNRIYLKRFLETLVGKMEAKALDFPGEIDVTGLHQVRTFGEFDDRFTARLHGFRDARDYWTRSSARQFLPGITIPTLLLNARNDPFLAPASFPFEEARQNPRFFLEAPASGGHVGFVDSFGRGPRWFEQRVVSFFEQAR